MVQRAVCPTTATTLEMQATVEDGLDKRAGAAIGAGTWAGQGGVACRGSAAAGGGGGSGTDGGLGDGSPN